MQRVLAVAVCGAWLAACGSSHSDDDASMDGGGMPDISIDVPVHPLPEAGGDGPLPDLGVDAGSDMGMPACFTGRMCDPVVGCNGGQQCQGQIMVPQNYDLPDGGTSSVDITFFEGGLCTNAMLGTPLSMIGATGACDPTKASDDPAMAGLDGCLPCARCVKLQDSTPTMPGIALCMQRCMPSDTTLGGCRAGWTCDPASHACLPPQCESDTQCRLHRVDTNGNGMLDMADHTALDPASTATCNMATGRCEDTGSTGGHATGGACTVTSDCVAGTICLSELEAHLPGGYCTRLYCDLPGSACDTGSDCRDLGGGLHLCLAPCTVGAEDASLVLGPGGHGDTCRPGYACYFDPMRSSAGASGNGDCITGNYNDVTTPNVGAACTMDAQCWSPHGLGKCLTDNGEDTCTVLECAGFADPDAACGTGNVCTVVGSFSLCAHECATPTDCGAANGGGPNVACLALVAGGPTVCWPGCQVTAQCQPGHTCVGASLTSQGHCT